MSTPFLVKGAEKRYEELRGSGVSKGEAAAQANAEASKKQARQKTRKAKSVAKKK